MAASADDLRGLHDLHRRARALRDRLESAPKTLAGREKALATRLAALEDARRTLKEAKAGLHKLETSVKAIQAKTDDLRVKLNTVKKNEEYKALQNQIAHDNASVVRLEDDILDGMTRIDTRAADLQALESDYAKFAAEVAALKADIAAKAGAQRDQLRELEAAIGAAESIIPEDLRERYRRTVKQRGDDAFAAVDLDTKSCSGCYVAVIPQAVNELLNGVNLTFCKTCGRILYLADEPVTPGRRSRS